MSTTTTDSERAESETIILNRSQLSREVKALGRTIDLLSGTPVLLEQMADKETEHNKAAILRFIANAVQAEVTTLRVVASLLSECEVEEDE
jgi:hypothetical protein